MYAIPPPSPLASATKEELTGIINKAHSLGLKTVLCLVLDNSWDQPQLNSRNGWCADAITGVDKPCPPQVLFFFEKKKRKQKRKQRKKKIERKKKRGGGTARRNKMAAQLMKCVRYR